MNPDWVWGLAGGLMIGTAAAMYLLINGRIMGASGILGGLIDGGGRDTAVERLAFLAALIIVPAGVIAAGMTTSTHLIDNIALISIAGLLTGIGTRLAGGCTSGHGVCGISRLSLRGTVATLIYIAAGAVTMLLFRHVWGII
jgi:uncharacterized protein